MFHVFICNDFVTKEGFGKTIACVAPNETAARERMLAFLTRKRLPQPNNQIGKVWQLNTEIEQTTFLE